jgi:trimethylamine--corrinoid protein Co-methyltransferase
VAEGKLTASFEKFALDVDLLEQFAFQARGIGTTDEELAFDALKELGPGGLYLAWSIRWPTSRSGCS